MELLCEKDSPEKDSAEKTQQKIRNSKDRTLSDIDNLRLPKIYNSESEKLEEIPLINYMKNLESKNGMLYITESAPAYKPEYTFENFVVGKSNELAHAMSLSVAHYPAMQYNPLFIYGPPGLGKTHLLYAITHEIMTTKPSFNILYVTSEDFTNELVLSITRNKTQQFREKYRNADVLLIDDIQFIGGKEATQEEFFHTFNALYDANKQIILSSDRLPKEINNLEQRLRSRFELSVFADIKPPDVELRSAIIKRKAFEMRLNIPNEVINYIADNVKDNVRQIEGLLKRIHAFSIVRNEPITTSLVKQFTSDITVNTSQITKEKILDCVCSGTGVSSEDILSKKKTKDIVIARQITSYFLRTLNDMSLMDIGKFLNRDHTTIMDSVEKIKNMISSDPAFSEKINKISEDIKN